MRCLYEQFLAQSFLFEYPNLYKIHIYTVHLHTIYIYTFYMRFTFRLFLFGLVFSLAVMYVYIYIVGIWGLIDNYCLNLIKISNDNICFVNMGCARLCDVYSLFGVCIYLYYIWRHPHIHTHKQQKMYVHKHVDLRP